MNNYIAQILFDASEKWGNKTALIFDQTGDELSFRELKDEVLKYASFLQKIGVKKGNKVSIMLPNTKEFPLFWLASAVIGAITVPMNNRYQKSDAQYVLEHSESVVIISSSEYTDVILSAKEQLEHVIFVSIDSNPHANINFHEQMKTLSETIEIEAVFEETLMNIQYTSGTTGYPKGCMLTQYYWVNLAKKVAEKEMLGLNEQDRLLTSQPFYYMDPQWNTMVCLMTGSTLVVLDRFSPSTFWSKVREHRITFFYCLGSMPVLLSKMPLDPNEKDHHLKFVACSAIPAEIHQEIESRFNVKWLEVFGMTETGYDISMRQGDHQAYIGTAALGKPAIDREVRMMNEEGQFVERGAEGEIVIRGKGMMLGYYKNPEATAEVFKNGWMHTGDLGWIDEEGIIHYAGRTKDMIRRSSENIAASEVEGIIHQHPDVKMATVIPVADEIRGEEIKAYIILRNPQEESESKAREILEFCKEHLALFKVPRYWEFVAEFPLTPSERVAKHILKKKNEAKITFILDSQTSK